MDVAVGGPEDLEGMASTAAERMERERKEAALVMVGVKVALVMVAKVVGQEVRSFYGIPKNGAGFPILIRLSREHASILDHCTCPALSIRTVRTFPEAKAHRAATAHEPLAAALFRRLC
ncbi:MAG: hypothetical protein SGPRY_004960 [Prymnesium sp.]